MSQSIVNILRLPKMMGRYPILLDFLKKNQAYIGALILLSGLINILALTPTLYMLQVFDRIFLSKSEVTLLTLTGITLFLYGVQAVSEWFRSRIIIALSSQLESELTPKLLYSIIFTKNLPKDFDSGEHLGHLMKFRQWITGPGAFVFLDLPWSPIFLVVMFLIHPLLGLAAILFMGLLGLYAWYSSKKLSGISKDTELEERELALLVQNKLDNADVIESMGMLKNLRASWWSKQLVHFKTQFENGLKEKQISLLSRQIRVLFQSLAITVAASLFIEGGLTLGSMIVASLLMSRATAPIDMLLGTWRQLQEASESLRKIQTQIESISHPLPVLEQYDFSHPYTFRDFSAYSTLSNKPFLLKEINCRLNPGHVYVILGGSGSGKSTFLKSLLGIWPDVSGSVTWGDADVYQKNLDQIRSQVGYLPQEVNLLRGTVAENIARYNELDSELVIKAASRVGIHQAILNLPDGYNTEIGSSGSYLSGGQRQRLALARAIYGDPKLVVLDEPNSNLDKQGEQDLNKLLVDLKNDGVTVFVVSHRPNVIQAADGVLIIKAGQLDYFNTKDQFVSEIQARQQASKVNK